MGKVARRIVFSGSVQGVGFRFTALNVANRYELQGYVRNMPNGTVEMFAQGDDRDIAEAIRDIQESFDGYLRDTQIIEDVVNPSYASFKIAF